MNDERGKYYAVVKILFPTFRQCCLLQGVKLFTHIGGRRVLSPPRHPCSPVTMKNTLESACPNAVRLKGLILALTRRPQRYNYLLQRTKQSDRKVLLSSFHLNGHTLGFHPQTQKLEQPCTGKYTAPQESTAQ